MKHEYGRSLIEVIGVLAIAGITSASAIGIYNSVRNTQRRAVAAAELEQVAKNVKILMGARGSYEGVSVDYLIKAGALNSAASPIGGEWYVSPGPTDTMFIIHLTELSEGDCDYFATAVPTWASTVSVNEYEYSSDLDSHCFSSKTNHVAFVVE